MRTFSLSLIEDGVDPGSMTLERDFCHRRRVVDVGPQADAPPSISAFMRAKFSACDLGRASTAVGSALGQQVGFNV